MNQSVNQTLAMIQKQANRPQNEKGSDCGNANNMHIEITN